MKKITNLLLVVAVVVLFTSSCEKEGVTVTKIIPVEINANDTYTYAIPHAGDADDVMQITTQASHYKASKITPASNDNVVFKYTPALNYAGTDEVQIGNAEGSHGNGGHGNCSGKHHHDDQVIYDFKISIKGTFNRSHS